VVLSLIQKKHEVRQTAIRAAVTRTYGRLLTAQMGRGEAASRRLSLIKK
jgi:hypothetical protein